MTPEEQVDAAFREAVAGLADRHGADPSALGALPPARALELFEAQAGSRHLDLAARWLRTRDRGYYTIGSAGHEANAAVAAATRPTDPALLHYRSGAFFLERARQAGVTTALRDVLLGVVAAREDPTSGGRHKVFGSKRLAVLPQTSTIASHLPRALGIAVSIGRTQRLGVPSEWPDDALVVASLGDASVNHSTATGAINATIHTAFQGIAVPLLLVCEDNGLGISVPTPPGWVEHAYGGRPGLAWFDADGHDLPAAVATAQRAADHVRERRAPAFLRLRTVRLMGHAGSDVEASYRTTAAVAADVARDPLVATARLLVEGGAASADEVLARYEHLRAEVHGLAREGAELPRLGTAAEVAAPLAPPEPDAVARVVATGPTPTYAGGSSATGSRRTRDR